MLAFAAARSAARLCAATLVLCAASAAPAWAEEDTGKPTGTVRITPASVAAGDDVELLVSACESDIGTASSEAFVIDAELSPAPGGTVRAEATVRSTTRAGSYPVRVDCGGRKGVAEGRVTVVEGDRPLRAPASDVPSGVRPGAPTHLRTEPVPVLTPTAPVRAGGGGTATGTVPGTADTGTDGSGVARTLGLGAAGLLTLTAAGRAVLLRRRVRSGAGD